MADEWAETKLGEIVDFQSGGTPSKSNACFWNGTIPWVSAKDMKRLFLDDSEDHITTAAIDNGTKVVPENTVLMLTRGMTLLNDVPICIVRRPMSFNQEVKAMRPKGELAGEYLPYLLLGNKHRLLGMVDLAGHGTGRLNTEELKALDLLLPPPVEQQAIARILGTLDDKIELNRRMNRTLEAMARALFQSWFVDFDPVRAKAAGQTPPGLAAHVAKLFPDAFENSDRGEIPMGWRVGRLDDLLILQRGFDLPLPKRVLGPYPVVAASGDNGTHNEFMVRGPGVTTGRSGVLGKVFFVHGDFWPLNTSLWVKDFKLCTPAYAFHLLSRLDFSAFNAGSAVPTLNRNHIHNLPVVVPPLAVIEAFDLAALALLQREKAADEQCKVLAALRGALLPKLISGELRVPNVERIARRYL